MGIEEPYSEMMAEGARRRCRMQGALARDLLGVSSAAVPVRLVGFLSVTLAGARYSNQADVAMNDELKTARCQEQLSPTVARS